MANASITKNYFYNLMYQILAILIPLITTPYVSRVLGAKGLGDYNYTMGIVTYFGIVAVTGTATFGNREIAMHQNNRKERSRLFWEIFAFRGISTLLTLILYAVFLNHWLLQYRELFLIQLFTVASWVVDVSWFCQGMENFKITALRNMFVKILGTILIFLFIKTKNDVSIYTFIYSFTLFLGNLTMWSYVFKNVDAVSLSELNIFRNTTGIMQLFAPVIAIQIYTVLDSTMLGSLDNTVQVGYYSQADKIIKLALTIISSFVTVLLPRIAYLYHKKRMNEMEKFIGKALDYIFMLSLPMMMGCILVIDQFVPVFFGPNYETVTPVIQVLSTLFLILSLGQLLGTLLVATHQQNQYTVGVTSAAVINLALNSYFLLHMHMGAIGVSIATVISELIATIVQQHFVSDIIKTRYVVKSFAKYLIPTMVMSLVIVGIRLIGPGGFISFVIEVIIGALAYLTMLIYRRDAIILQTIQKIASKF